MSNSLAAAISATASNLGISAHDLATVMSYETAGTFDPWKAGPVTQYGRHRGLIQWGEPQREKYGVYEGMPVEDQVTAAGRYLVDAGVRPGMGLLDIYSAINAGRVGRYNASDANNGGAPGTVRDKVETQMEGHKAKAAALLGGSYVPPPSMPSILADNPYQSADITTQPIRTDADLWSPQPEQDSYGAFDAVQDSFSSDSFTAWTYRRMTEGALDPAWKGPEAGQWEALSKTLPSTYYDYVMGAGSEEAFASRIRNSQEDIERQQRLADLGAEGVAIRLATSIFDPVTLPLNLATGGLGASVMAGARSASLAARVGVGALTAGASNAAIEATFGAATDDPHADPLMAFGVGAMLGGVGGGLARKASTSWEAQELRNIGEAATAQARDPEALPYVVGGQGNLGAAGTGMSTPDFILDPQHVPEAFGGRARFDVVGQMTTAKEPRTRLMGYLFGEETVGRKDYGVIEDPVTVKRKALEMRLWGRVDKVVQPARKAWMEEQGALWWNPVERTRLSDEFSRLTFAAVRAAESDADLSPHVAKARDAYRQFFGSYQEYITNPRWETGGYAEPIGNIQKNHQYAPLYANHQKIADVASRVPEKTMERFILNAVTAHNPDIDIKLAKRMAKGYWRNLRRAGYGIEEKTDLSLSLGDRELFRESFKDANRGLNGRTEYGDDEIDAMYDALAGMASKVDEKAENAPARLKRRSMLDYDYQAEVEGYGPLKITDLFNNDMEFVTRRYNRTMSARIALAQTQVKNPATGEVFMDGIRSQADFDRLKNWVREGYAERGGDLDKSRGEMDNALANMEFMWDGINGRPMYGSEREIGQWVRRIKAFQFIRLMNNMGLNQVQETWKLIGTLGAKASFQQMPAIRRFVDEAGVSKPVQDELLNELEDITGIGLEGLFGRHDFALMDDRIGAIEKGYSVSKLDAALDWGQKATADISFMKALTTYQQRWAIKAISQRLYDIAKLTRKEDGSFDFSGLKGREAERLQASGLGEDEARLLFGNMLEHGGTDGTRLTSLGTSSWDPEAVVKLTHLMNRMSNRIVQANDVGGLAKWMSQPLLQLFTQFRSFVLGAWGKSTLYNIHHFDPQTFVLMMGEMALGMATFAVRSSNQLATESGAERFWEETMSAENLLKNGFARTASASIIPMLIDTGLMFTPMGPQFGNARASGQATDALLGSPAGSMLEDVRVFARGLQDSVIDDRDMSQTELRAGWRTLPFGNWMPLMGIFESMIEDRDPFPPRD